MTNATEPPLISGLAELAPLYRFLLCDVWGVVHNGISAHRPAVAALARFRAEGGRVVLITNAPRPKSEVVAQLDRLGAARAAYDEVVTSGEAARDYLAARPGSRIFHLGPPRDLPLYHGLPVTLTGEADAELVSCTGLFDDETETPDDYAGRLAGWRERGLPMLCVNPDKVVERGDRLVWCAGAIAERYAAIGGETIVVGKPHAPIYATAFARMAAIAGGPVPKSAVLAIGDAIETDLRGACDAGLDVLFVTGGIHAALFGARERPELASVHAVVRDNRLAARAILPRLVWDHADLDLL